MSTPYQACVQQIVNALRQYEVESGQVVESVDTERQETTTYSDESKTFIRTVTLTLRPTPKEWQ